jgi:hypothetical protein
LFFVALFIRSDADGSEVANLVKYSVNVWQQFLASRS